MGFPAASLMAMLVMRPSGSKTRGVVFTSVAAVTSVAPGGTR
jgi:hypothetical protein